MRVGFAICVFVTSLGLATVAPMQAISLPDFPLPPTPEPTPAAPQKVRHWQQECAAAGVTPTPTTTQTKIFGLPLKNAVAVNVDYVHSKQDLDVGLNGQSFPATSELNSYTARLEYQPVEVFSLYGIGGYHTGSTETPQFNTETDLDGWAAGVGTTTILPVPLPCKAGNLFCLVPFGLFDFNYTYNDYKDVENGIDIFNFTTRFGAIGTWLSHRIGFGLWAGPAYQTVEREQRVKFNGQTVPLNSSPKKGWNGVIGALVSWVSPKKRAPISMTLEGGVGNRNQILVSLRYEWLP